VKSNEIKAVPKLLDLLDIEGHTISLDAMGCQKKIARKIHFAHADYLLALKGNHPHLYQRLEQFFSNGGATEELFNMLKTKGLFSQVFRQKTKVMDVWKNGSFSPPTHWIGLTKTNVKVGSG